MNLFNNRLYVPLILALFGMTYLLNFCNTIYQCSLLFVLISLVTNGLAESYGIKKALIGLFCATAASVVLLWNFDYYIAGRVVEWLAVVSLLSVLISNSLGAVVFIKIKHIFGFEKRNFLSTIIVSAIDGLVMSIFFMNTFRLQTILSILAKEITFKCLMAAVIYAIISLTMRLLRIDFADSK